jgi:dTDP-4-dehydrorhamnose reductase
MRILITGASGRIGRGVLENLEQVFNPEVTIHLLTRNSIFSPQPTSLNTFKDVRTIGIGDELLDESGAYDFALHLAGAVDTKYCNKPENAQAVIDANVSLTARVCQSAKRVLMTSTDNVFSGTDGVDLYGENDVPSPGNFYGVSKVCAEQIVLHFNGIVVRVQSMLGVENRLITPMVQVLRGKNHAPFWNNIFIRPTYFFDFLQIIRKLYLGDQKKIVYHCSCKGKPLSRFQIADVVLEYFQRHDLHPSQDEMAQEECRIPFPRLLALDTFRTQTELGIEFTDRLVAIERHLDSMLLK